jgi:hypothetical protein
VLLKKGYTQSEHDTRAFAWRNGDRFINMCIHVDDFFVIASDQELLTDLYDYLVEVYGDVSCKSGDVLEYLGIQVKILPTGELLLTQPLLTNRIIEEFLSADDIPDSMKFKKPMKGHSVDRPDDNVPMDQTEYLRIVGSVNFLAQYTRPDLLFSMSIAAQQCSKPTRKSLRLVQRILKYLAVTRGYGVTYSKGKVILFAHADAAHNCYTDAKGHYGYTFSLGENDGTFFAVSKKLKLVTLSSTESEYVALCETAKEAIWLRGLLNDLGWFQDEPTVIFQDNMSTIDMVGGHRRHQASKHIRPKFHITGNWVDQQEIVLRHKASKEMIADILTKSLPTSEHAYLTCMLLNRRSIEGV